MDVRQALKLKKGDKIRYPEDRGTQGGQATVTKDCKNYKLRKAISGEMYIMIPTDNGVWPSNRI